MKFKIGDKVRACGGFDWGEIGTIIGIDDDPDVPYETTFGWKMESNLELVQEAEPKVDTKGTQPESPSVTLDSSPDVRVFSGGATRDTTQGKLDYVKALSPIVLRRYVQYLDKHRLQPDGNYRDFDNWKLGIPNDVCLSSLGRHYWDVWLLMHGYETADNHGPVDIKSALCGVIFNAMTVLHNIEAAELKAGTLKGYWGV